MIAKEKTIELQTKDIDATVLPEGHILHGYKITGLLGRGGFGTTYRAKDTTLDKDVAIKEYYPHDICVRQNDFSVRPITQKYEEEYYVGLDRFIQEARNISRFEHPNIARVHTLFEENNAGYMVMKYEKGQNIKEIRESRQFSENELLKIVSHILGALELLHSNDFIHRDIKPENIIIRDDGTPVLIDFGSARDAQGQTEKNLTCLVSPGYAPIEQYVGDVKNDRQGACADIYSFSATLYYAVSGISPSVAINRGDSILQTNRDTYVPIELIAKNQYSKKFLKAIDKGLAFKQKDRPQSVAEWWLMFDTQKSKDTGLKLFNQPEQANIANLLANQEVDKSFFKKSIQTIRKTGMANHKAILLSLCAALIIPMAGDINKFIMADVLGINNKVTNAEIVAPLIHSENFNPLSEDKIVQAHDITDAEGLSLKFNLRTNTDSNTPRPGVEDSNFIGAVNTLMPLAENGKAFAQYDLGIIFFIRDIDKSLKWFHVAAEQGYAPAQKQLGFIYDNGINVVEDDEKAFNWYRLAAEQGNAEAQFMLGTMYLNGDGIKANKNKASEWLNLAGQKGFKNAQDTLRQINQQLKLINST